MSAVYEGALIAVDGNYDDVNRLAQELAAENEDWAFVNVNVRPYYAEGSKTLGYEVAEQLGWRLPDQIVVPIASGSQLTKVDKAFRELGQLDLVEATPYKVFGAQATGCSPISSAFKAGHDVIRPVRPPYPPGTAFDVVVRRLPPDFWVHWGPVYKEPLSDLLAVAPRVAADRFRRLPVVVREGLPRDQLDAVVRWLRRLFHADWGSLTPADAVEAVPRPPAPHRDP